MIKDEPVAWDNPATVAYLKHRRRKTGLQAVACVALIFLAAQLSRLIPGISHLLVFINAGLFMATVGFLLAYSRLSLRERTLRMADWTSVDVIGYPFRLYGIPVGTVLRIENGPNGELIRMATYRAGAELLDASLERRTLLRAGDSDRGFVLAPTGGAPVVLARRIGPTFLQGLVLSTVSERKK